MVVYLPKITSRALGITFPSNLQPDATTQGLPPHLGHVAKVLCSYSKGTIQRKGAYWYMRGSNRWLLADLAHLCLC